MVRLTIDFEFGSRAWWDNGGQDLWDGIREGFEGSGVLVDDHLADSWLGQARAIEGWDLGTEYAPHPVRSERIDDEDLDLYLGSALDLSVGDPPPRLGRGRAALVGHQQALDGPRHQAPIRVEVDIPEAVVVGGWQHQRVGPGRDRVPAGDGQSRRRGRRWSSEVIQRRQQAVEEFAACGAEQDGTAADVQPLLDDIHPLGGISEAPPGLVEGRAADRGGHRDLLSRDER